MPRITAAMRAVWKESLADWCLDYLQAKPAAIRRGVDAAELERIEHALLSETPSPDDAYEATVAIRQLTLANRESVQEAERQLAFVQVGSSPSVAIKVPDVPDTQLSAAQIRYLDGEVARQNSDCYATPAEIEAMHDARVSPAAQRLLDQHHANHAR